METLSDFVTLQGRLNNKNRIYKLRLKLCQYQSLVEVEFGVEVGVEFEVEFEVGVEVAVEVGVEVGGLGFWVWLTFSHVYYFHRWVGGWLVWGSQEWS